jgi:hypothetical protein
LEALSVKATKVMAIMKRGKSVTICRKGYPNHAADEDVIEAKNGNGPQWITDGKGAYNLDGAPLIESSSQFYTAYDVSEKQQVGFYFKFSDLPEVLSEICYGDENLVDAIPSITIGTLNRVLKVFVYSGQVMFIDSAYLAPFGSDDARYLEFAVGRDVYGRDYLCVYYECNIEAVIYPVEFGAGEATNKICDALALCTRKLKKDGISTEELAAQAMLDGENEQEQE